MKLPLNFHFLRLFFLSLNIFSRKFIKPGVYADIRFPLGVYRFIVFLSLCLYLVTYVRSESAKSCYMFTEYDNNRFANIVIIVTKPSFNTLYFLNMLETINGRKLPNALFML